MTVRSRRLLGSVATAASALAASGCFAYRAAEPARVQPGEGVRVVLNAEGSQELTRQVGPRVTRLEGRVIGAPDSALALAVRQLMRTPASEEFWNGDSVFVPVRAVDAVSVRRLDRRRSALAVGGTLAAVYVLRRVIQEAGVFGSGQTRPPGQQ